MTMHVQQACDQRFNEDCIHKSSDPFPSSSTKDRIEARPLYDGRISEALRISATPDAIRTRSPFTLCMLAAAAGPLDLLQDGSWARVTFDATQEKHVKGMKDLIFFALHKIDGDMTALEQFRANMELVKGDRKMAAGHVFPHRDELGYFLGFVRAISRSSSSAGPLMSDQYAKSIPCGLKKHFGEMLICIWIHSLTESYCPC
jgi:hypothetical protein